MTVAQQSLFPSIDSVFQLARSIVNDTFTGVNGAQGRILTNDAPFSIPMLNSALRTLQRKLRNEGVTWPIQDNFILSNVTAVVAPDPAVQIYIGYNGYFDGTTLHASPTLPNDLMQPYMVEERTTNSGLPFTEMTQPQAGLPSTLQGSYLGVWEWRNYKIYMPGSTLTKDLRLRYKSVLVPLNVPSSAFASTSINIIDCEDALAYHIAAMYATARGAAAAEELYKMRDDAIFDIANEWVRRGQAVAYRRPAYSGSQQGGSNGGQVGQTK